MQGLFCMNLHAILHFAQNKIKYKCYTFLYSVFVYLKKNIILFYESVTAILPVPILLDQMHFG